MKPRSSISAAELSELYDRLDRQLDRVGLETQPRVAVRLLELISQDGAQIKDYNEALRTDAALTGRLLRLANSAYFAQRTPVTKLERALVLLGIQRVKAVSLGFYLSKAAATAGAKSISREVWGQSVFRACLAAALARSRGPALASEAFVVGLMLDCGIPLMAKMLGGAYEQLYVEHGRSPAKLYNAELEHLEFTHVDMAAALTRRWRLPAVLAKPIVWHHTPPPSLRGTEDGVGAPALPAAPLSAQDATALLQRIGYYAGAVTLDAFGSPAEPTPLPSIGSRVLDVGPPEITRAVRAAAQEHGAVSQLFDGVAKGVDDPEALAESVSLQLVGVLDEQMIKSLRQETGATTSRLSVAGYELELQQTGAPGRVTVYLDTASGERVISCTVAPAAETPATLRRSLGLEDASEDEMKKLVGELRAMAA